MFFRDTKGATPLSRAFEAIRVMRGGSAELAGAVRGGRGQREPPRPLRGAPVPPWEPAHGAVSGRREGESETPGAAHPVRGRVGGAEPAGMILKSAGAGESRERAVTR